MHTPSTFGIPTVELKKTLILHVLEIFSEHKEFYSIQASLFDHDSGWKTSFANDTPAKPFRTDIWKMLEPIPFAIQFVSWCSSFVVPNGEKHKNR